MAQIPEMDSGEKRLNELGYKQELRREMVLVNNSFLNLCLKPQMGIVICLYICRYIHLRYSFLTTFMQNLFKTLAISFSTMTLFTGITPLYGSSLLYAGPASLVWGWVVVSFFTWFVGIAMAEICSSFPVSPPFSTSLLTIV